MQTLRLKISDKVFDRLIKVLNTFTKEEVIIINDDSKFIKNQKYLQEEYSEIVDGKTKFIDIDEADTLLEDIVKKNENSL